MKKENNYIDECLEDFDKKFCPNDIWDTKLITFELKDWLKQKLQEVETRKGEEIRVEIEKEFTNNSDINKKVQDILNLKSLKTK